jgi:hypothetical protein
VGLWRLLYRALGYGAWGTAYIDPLHEPVRYIQALVARGPLLLLGQWTPLPAEVSPFLAPIAGALLWCGALALLAGLAWVLAPTLRADRQARFWATGMLLALLPVCAALPANRLLFFVGIGAFGLLARFVYAHAPGEAAPQRLARRGLLLVHLLLAPLALPAAAYSPALLGNVEQALQTLPYDTAVRERELVVVAAPTIFWLNVIDQVRAEAGVPAPARTLLLAPGLGGVHLARPERATLVVRPAGGYMLGFDGVFRAPWCPLRLGERVRLARVSVEVSELTPDGRPAAAIFRFDTPLEDATRQWFVWQGGAYVHFALPQVGETVWIEQ